MIFPNYKPVNFGSDSCSYDILNIHFKNYKINVKKYTKNLEEREKLLKQEGGKINQFNFYDNKYFDNEGDEYSIIKEDIINWFFSLSLEERMKIATIENNTVVDIFHQMNYYTTQEGNSSFAFSQNDIYEENCILKKSEKESFLQSSILINTNSFLENTHEGITDKALYNNSLNRFFIHKIQEHKYDRNFSFHKSLLSENIMIFSVHSDLDCISLSPKLIDDKNEFLKYFNYFSFDKSFTDLIEIHVYNKNKANFFSIPKWIGTDFFPGIVIILALIEQVIIIKFILNYGKNLNNIKFEDITYNKYNKNNSQSFVDNQNNITINPDNNSFENRNAEIIIRNNFSNRNSSSNSSLNFSLINEVKLKEFFERRKNLIFFLSDNYPKLIKLEHLEYHSMNNNSSQAYFDNLERFIGNKKDPEFLIHSLNIPELLININNNKKINDFISLKNRQIDKLFKNFYPPRLYNNQNINFKNLKLFIIGKDEFETEKNFLVKYKEDIILFIDFLIFYNVELIWKKEYFLFKDITNKIFHLYTEKNALDLIKEMENDTDDSISIIYNKKSKNGKKNGNHNSSKSNNIHNKKINENIKCNNINNNIYNISNNNNIQSIKNSNIMYNNSTNFCTNNNNTFVNNNFYDDYNKLNFNYFKPYIKNNTFFKASELNDPYLLQKYQMSNYYKDHVMAKNIDKIIKTNLNESNNQDNTLVNKDKKPKKLKSKSTSGEKNIRLQEKNTKLLIGEIIISLIEKSVEISNVKFDNSYKIDSIDSNTNTELSKSIKQKFLNSMENDKLNNQNFEKLENIDFNKNLNYDIKSDVNNNLFEELVNLESKNKKPNAKYRSNNPVNLYKEKVKLKIIKNYFACSEDLLIAEKNTEKYANLINLDKDEYVNLEKKDEAIDLLSRGKKNTTTHELRKNKINLECQVTKNHSREYIENIQEINNINPSKKKENDSDFLSNTESIENLNKIEVKNEVTQKIHDEEKNAFLNTSNNSIQSDKNKKKKKEKQQTFYKISTKKSFPKQEKQLSNSKNKFNYCQSLIGDDILNVLQEKTAKKNNDQNNFSETNNILNKSERKFENEKTKNDKNRSDNNNKNNYNYNKKNKKQSFEENNKHAFNSLNKIDQNNHYWNVGMNNNLNYVSKNDDIYSKKEKLEKDKLDQLDNNQKSNYKIEPNIINNNIYYSNKNTKNNPNFQKLKDGVNQVSETQLQSSISIDNPDINININNKNEKNNKNYKNHKNNKQSNLNNSINRTNNSFKNNSINYIENSNNDNNNINYFIPNFNSKSNIDKNNNHLGFQDNTNSLGFRKSSFNNSHLSNNSYSNLKNPITSKNNSPNFKHKNSFNCKDNRNGFDIELILNNMNSNKINNQIKNNSINYNNSNNNNSQINININNNTNFFNLNFEAGNQFFSEQERIPRKRSHNTSGNFSNGILDQIANGVNPMNSNMNLQMNNFINSNNFYGKVYENMGNISSMGSLNGIPSQYDIPNFANFSNFPPFNFNNANPIINFNFNNNIPYTNSNVSRNNFGFYGNINQNISNNCNNFFHNYATNLDNGNNTYNGKINMLNQDYIMFTCKIHNDILDYTNDVNKIVEVLKPIKLNVVAKIEKMLKQFLEFEITIDVFGSFASDLSIESSDIDLKVNILNENSDNIDYDRIIFSLVKFFNGINVFENVTPIHTASIPIIKLVCDPRKLVNDDNFMIFEEFKYSELYRNFKFCKEELNKFKIDLTFLGLIKKQQNSLDSINFAKNNISLFPEIKPILFILKRLLQENNLNSAFNGGLSSYCIFLLILSYIKFKNNTLQNTNNNFSYIAKNPIGKIEYNSTNNNLGVLILDLLECYGKYFEFHLYSIDVNQTNPFIFTNHCYDHSPIILDPINYHNASKTSFRIDEVKDFLGKSYDFLIYNKMDNTGKITNNFNLIYEMILHNK